MTLTISFNDTMNLAHSVILLFTVFYVCGQTDSYIKNVLQNPISQCVSEKMTVQPWGTPWIAKPEHCDSTHPPQGYFVLMVTQLTSIQSMATLHCYAIQLASVSLASS